jgi:hypothetical protein
VSLPLAITVIVLADLALLGLLAFVMSRAALLTPHAAGEEVRLARRAPAHTPHATHVPRRATRGAPIATSSRS